MIASAGAGAGAEVDAGAGAAGAGAGAGAGISNGGREFLATMTFICIGTSSTG